MLLFVWPLIFGGLVALGEGIVGLDAVGAGIYAFLNRLLIPVGLHHALNNVFWFDTIGLGDLSHFWAGETSADVSWSLGMYMSGFFPCMMFGVPGAALAMIQTAKSTKKKVAIGLVGSAALCAFICGVTEPFEFAFMFLAPGLYVVYALLYGIFTVITVLVGFRAGFSFSAGATDLLFSASLPAAANTWMIIPLGIAAFVVFYLVFRFAIVKFDLKTPGREDDDTEAEKQVVLANNDYTKVGEIVLEGIGGKDNVVSLDNCITRRYPPQQEQCSGYRRNQGSVCSRRNPEDAVKHFYSTGIIVYILIEGKSPPFDRYRKLNIDSALRHEKPGTSEAPRKRGFRFFFKTAECL